MAKRLNTLGVTAFVLKYRLPKEGHQAGGYSVSLQDAQRAVRLIRSNAANWGLDPKRIGFMGFSAGGHGFGIRFATGPISRWTELCKEWLSAGGYIMM